MKQLELQAFIWQQTADKDWSLNNMNWLALSGAAPWSPPFFRVYHPARCSDDSLRGEAWVILEIHCGGAKDGLITECKGPRGGLVSMILLKLTACVLVFHFQGKFIREFIPELHKMPSKIPRWNERN